MMRSTILAAFGLTLCAGCAMDGLEPSGGRRAETAEASLQGPAGQQVARAVATEQSTGIRVRLQAAGLKAGTYAVHVHAAGRCDGPDFVSAGPHWNPAAKQHGRENPQGAHKGDLPNLVVSAAGRGAVEFLILDATLSDASFPMLDSDGAALVIHERADDHRTDPSGNSGARIACGVFGRASG